MKWICRRCGLQRDDRRGSNCKDVKGQAHDWMETEDFINGLSQNLYKKWLETTEGKCFSKKKEYINNEYQQSIAILQNSDVTLQQKRHDKLWGFFYLYRKLIVIGLIIISIGFAIFFKSFKILISISLFAGFTWLLFFILEKIHYKKFKAYENEYYEMKRSCDKKKWENEEILQNETEKLLIDYIKKTELAKVFDNKMLSAIYKKLHNKMTGNDYDYDDNDDYEDDEEIGRYGYTGYLINKIYQEENE